MKVSQEAKNEVLAAYTDIKFPGAFGGVANFQKYLSEKKNLKLSRHAIKQILEKLPVYQVHAFSKNRFKRRKLTTKGAGIDFHADVGYMPEYDGYNYFILLVDLYSNYIYVEPLETKSADSIKKAFNDILKNNNLFKFSTLGTDAGAEFIANRHISKAKILNYISEEVKIKHFRQRILSEYLNTLFINTYDSIDLRTGHRQ